MNSGSPLHAGEMFLQRTVGAADRVAGFAGQAIRNHMPDQHRAFFAQLPFVVLASVDPEGNPWATLHTGSPGFASSPDPHRLQLDGQPATDDPVGAGLADGSSVGLLGIELQTRRRNRMNGHVSKTADGFEIAVEHSFGNCPQYIQRRAVQVVVPHPEPPIRSDTLTARARAFIERSDTFYVGSYVDLAHGRQVDVSHRGGKPGFVDIDAAGVLTVPDFAGNLLFNTLGNFQLNPRGALLFVDFETGDMLHLTGTVQLVLEGPEIAAFHGAERLWRFRTTALVLRPGAMALRARFLDASPNNDLTGSWEQARSRLEAADARYLWQRFQVAQIVEESTTIRSLVLEPLGPGRVQHLAGQHIPIRVNVPGHPKPLVRSYSLSFAPGDDDYRISVKRQGVVSAGVAPCPSTSRSPP